MFVFKRNQIIVTALVAMIAIAGYLNYTDSSRMKDAEVVYDEELDVTSSIPDDAMIMETMETTDPSDGIIGEALTNDPELLALDDFEQASTDKDSLAVASGEETADNEDPGAAVFVNSSTDTPYFAQAKLDREQARAQEKEILTQLLNNKDLEKDKKSKAAEEMLNLQKRIEKESATEAMIEAKGFKEVYVRINDNGVDVVVNKEKLTEQELAQIEKIVRNATGFDADKIQIIPLK
ncbi:SpoIIIAH-like family protein [Defluviitalea raffinosedens]|jgi:stage III sporulation protein AH|uniref:SpoIIIAH-like family protein n=1 Tax=Defluviitalea raffinosedens TaxID=1450156 RepID=UPI001765AD2A|nr:SpoIIIAH-like family protein [Defluviitalea raffinosedens]MBM7685530.1 stage III sporulation protein AH [Defluviitalea raffinosedens]MBZ4668538.1 SpoIIIAH-like protein [Defluviitaleaceae bacterium]HHW66741.1 SpoIIIAH-like family protein [Candidatus Epulonipiscium sp.]